MHLFAGLCWRVRCTYADTDDVQTWLVGFEKFPSAPWFLFCLHLSKKKILGNSWLKIDFLTAVIQLKLPGILKHLLSNHFAFSAGHL